MDENWPNLQQCRHLSHLASMVTGRTCKVLDVTVHMRTDPTYAALHLFEYTPADLVVL